MDNGDGGWDNMPDMQSAPGFLARFARPLFCAADVLPSPVFRFGGPLR